MPFRFVEEEKISSTPTSQEQKPTSSRFRFVEEQPSKIRSVLSAFPKGAVKELRKEFMKTPILGKGLRELQQEVPEIVLPEEKVQEKIESLLPTQEGFTEDVLQRGGKIFPYAALGGGNIAAQGLRSLGAALLGQTAQELGAPPMVQALAELPAFLTPAFSKKLLPKGTQKEIVEGARRIGLTDEEITPLIQSEFKQKWLTKVAPTRGRIQTRLSKSKEALGNVYNRLETSDVAKTPISSDEAIEVMDSIDKVLEKLPSGVRKEVQVDFNELLNAPMTGETLINFWKDLNHYIGKGTTELGLLKGPITDALERASPELAADFRLTNQLYSKYSTISKRLKPTLFSDIMTAGRAGRVIVGLMTGNYPILGEALAEGVGKQLTIELLTNPKLQNLSSKMSIALNDNKFALANQFLEKYIEELNKTDSETASLIRDIDFRSLNRKQQKPKE